MTALGRIFSRIFTAAFLMAAIGAGGAAASPLYAIDTTTDGLVSVDTTTGATSAIGGPIAAITQYFPGMSSYNAANGIYSFMGNAGGWKLFSVDTATGNVVSSPAVTSSLQNPEYDPSGNLTSLHLTDHTMRSIDPVTGTVTPVGSPIANVNGQQQGTATVDRNTGIYTTQIRISGDWKVMSIDSSTGNIQNAPSLSSFHTGLRYDDNSGLFGLNFVTDDFVSVDPVTGAVNTILNVSGLIGVSQGSATLDLDTGIYSFLGRLQSDGLWHVISIDTVSGTIVDDPAAAPTLINFEYGYSAAASVAAPGMSLIFTAGIIVLAAMRRRMV